MTRVPVLLVDDDAALRTLVATLLDELGCEILEAGSLAEARALISTRRMQVAIVDGVLPDGTGSTLLAELREADAEVALVYISAFLPSGSELSELANRVGLSSVLAKPFAPADFVSDVSPLLMRHKAAAGPDSFELLRREYAATLRAQVDEFDEAVAGGNLDAARRVAHRLHGTAGTYGFDRVSSAAAVIESAIPPGGTSLPAGLNLVQLAEALRAAADREAER